MCVCICVYIYTHTYRPYIQYKSFKNYNSLITVICKITCTCEVFFLCHKCCTKHKSDPIILSKYSRRQGPGSFALCSTCISYCGTRWNRLVRLPLLTCNYDIWHRPAQLGLLVKRDAFLAKCLHIPLHHYYH